MVSFYVKVQPDSEEFRLEKGSILQAYLNQPAENGMANSELVRKLEQILGQKPAIISGHKSSRKKLKVDMQEEKLEEELTEATD
jgi:uncharacterized protein YggU (UPF0235/DUF167 family)